ncbi:MAG: hypothetical protein JSR47_15360 [Proteobacteria bacterium]|nr:hypothetical protein [Pseudomonadota bacterium]
MVMSFRWLAIFLTLVVSACDDSQDVLKRVDEPIFRPVVDQDVWKKPNQVKPGMSLREVEALVGPGAKEPCWHYERVGATDKVCFVDGLVNAYNTSAPDKSKPKLVHVDGIFAGKWPLEQLPPPNATKVTLGMSQKRVEELWGRPNAIDDKFTVSGDEYRGTFVGGRLTVFEPVPMPPVP